MTKTVSNPTELTSTELRVRTRRRQLAASFVQRANAKTAPYVYTYPNLPQELGSKDVVTAVCDLHGPFQVQVNRHLTRAQYCPVCTRERLNAAAAEKARVRCVQELERLIQGRLRLVHPAPAQFNATTRVELECLKHPGTTFCTSLTKLKQYQHLGCNLCKAEHASALRRKSQEQAIADFQLTHGGRYDYSRVAYCDNKTKVAIVCPIHGPFEQTPVRHAYGDGCPKCAATASKAEQQVRDYVESLGLKVETHNRTVIYPKEVDVYVPEARLAVEYCGLYWHSEARRDKDYHAAKLQDCRAAGVRLIQVFEDEWRDRPSVVQSMLRQVLKQPASCVVPARTATLVELPPSVARQFLHQNHLQGADAASLYFGLLHNQNLVAVLSMARPSISGSNRSYEWNISRFAVKCNYHSPGAFSRLLTYFKRKYSPQSILTYADLRWSEGNVYLQNGFKKIGESAPNYWYFLPSRATRHHRFNFRKSLLAKKLIKFDSAATERENMLKHGWLRIYDAGNASFGWHA